MPDGDSDGSSTKSRQRLGGMWRMPDQETAGRQAPEWDRLLSQLPRIAQERSRSPRRASTSSTAGFIASESAGAVSKEQQARNSFIYLLPMVVSALVPIVTLPIFTRILTREDYGAWALAVAYGSFLAGLSNFGLVVSYERNFFQYPTPKERSALLYSSIAFALLFLNCLILSQASLSMRKISSITA